MRMKRLKKLLPQRKKAVHDIMLSVVKNSAIQSRKPCAREEILP